MTPSKQMKVLHELMDIAVKIQGMSNRLMLVKISEDTLYQIQQKCIHVSPFKVRLQTEFPNRKIIYA